MVYVTGAFTSRDRRVGLRGDTLAIDIDRCEVFMDGVRLFGHDRVVGGVEYRQGLVRDKILFMGSPVKARFIVHRGPFGSRLLESLSASRFSAPVASRRVVLDVLGELGWLINT